MKLKIGEQHVDVSVDFIRQMEDHCKDVLDAYYMAVPNNISDEEYIELRKATQQCRLDFWRKWNDTIIKKNEREF